MYLFAKRGIFITSEDIEGRFQASLVERLPTKIVLFWFVKAQRFLWSHQPHEALTAIHQEAHLVSQADRQREPIRMNRLYGAAYLAMGNLASASEYLQIALLGAREINLVEEELHTLPLLAEQYNSGKSSTPRGNCWHKSGRRPNVDPIPFIRQMR